MSDRRLVVFLSSTGEDLKPWRRAVIDHMRPLDGFICDAMEDFGARDATALAFCRERALACDVFVGLVGVYRGSEPPGDNQLRSYTELEYDWAGDGGKSRLMYLTPEGFVLTPDLAMTPEQAARQRAFRAASWARKLSTNGSSRASSAHPMRSLRRSPPRWRTCSTGGCSPRSDCRKVG